MAPSPDAVFVGVATWDTVAQLPCLPPADGRVVAEDMVWAGGGPAATAAVAFARLGLRAAVVAAVGDDRQGTLIADGLADEGVDVGGVRTVAGQPSGSCVVLIDRPRASRAICVRPGPELRVEPGSEAARAIVSAPLLLVDHVGWPAVAPLLAALPAAARRPVVCYDAGNLLPGPRPAGVEVYVPTLDVLREVYDGRQPADLLRAALRSDPATTDPAGDGPATTDPAGDGPAAADPGGGPGAADPVGGGPGIADPAGRAPRVRVVATDGPHGAYAADAGGCWRVPGLAGIEVRSTLGAGDVFHGALVAALARTFDLPAALAYANAAAALSCRGLDGRSGIPGHAETLAAATAHPAAPLPWASAPPAPGSRP
ncbi:PfkB family carbohydrate kinase [Nonomuraea sp. NPDC050404]|uniref:carbohydrate kinase family protein n=1 Tax=Nonomuraea sp. NPDC050404 TaxID=3155783 RepID=UPI0033FC3768